MTNQDSGMKFHLRFLFNFFPKIMSFDSFIFRHWFLEASGGTAKTLSPSSITVTPVYHGCL